MVFASDDADGDKGVDSVSGVVVAALVLGLIDVKYCILDPP
jgi:hypothetical protein